MFHGSPRLFVCLHFVPRSGSNLLADLMRQTERMGFPLEYFSPANLADLSARIPGLSLSSLGPLFERRTSPNGIFAYKWNSDFEGLAAEAEAARAFAPKANIFIDRRDRDAQARSYLVAGRTGIWARQNGVRYEVREPDLSARELREAKTRLAELRARTWAIAEVDGGQVLRVFAEDLFQQPARVLGDVMRFCGIATEGLVLPDRSMYTSSSAGAATRGLGGSVPRVDA